MKMPESCFFFSWRTAPLTLSWGILCDLAALFFKPFLSISITTLPVQITQNIVTKIRQHICGFRILVQQVLQKALVYRPKPLPASPYTASTDSEKLLHAGLCECVIGLITLTHAYVEVLPCMRCSGWCLTGSVASKRLIQCLRLQIKCTGAVVGPWVRSFLVFITPIHLPVNESLPHPHPHLPKEKTFAVYIVIQANNLII